MAIFFNRGMRPTASATVARMLLEEGVVRLSNGRTDRNTSVSSEFHRPLFATVNIQTSMGKDTDKYSRLMLSRPKAAPRSPR